MNIRSTRLNGSAGILLLACLLAASCDRAAGQRSDDPAPPEPQRPVAEVQPSAAPQAADGTVAHHHPRPQITTVAVAEAQAQPARSLILAIEALPQQRWPELLGEEVATTAAAWRVTLDAEALDALFAGRVQHVRLPIGAAATVTGAVTHRRERGPLSATVQGRVDGTAGDHFSLVRHRGVLLGEIARYSDSAWYEIGSAADGSTVLRQLDDAAYTARCGIQDDQTLAEEPAVAHALGDGLATDGEPSGTRPTARMCEAQKVEAFRFPLSALRPTVRRQGAELDEPGLVGM
jgi:hypothetical protein